MSNTTTHRLVTTNLPEECVQSCAFRLLILTDLYDTSAVASLFIQLLFISILIIIANRRTSYGKKGKRKELQQS